MSQPEPTISATECTLETIMAFLIPFFLAGAGGNPEIAKAAVRDLIAAHNPVSGTEMDLAGRIVAFGIVGMDNFRLSAAPGLSDTKVLRYRGNAVTLIRSSDQARKTLATMRETGEQPHKIPRPAVAPAPAPVAKTPAFAQSAPASTAASKTLSTDFEAMKRDARTLMQVFSKNSGTSAVSMPMILDPSAAAAAAASAAMGKLRRA